MEVKGKIVCKKSDNKAFKLGDDWYNCNDPVVPFLEKMAKGDDVTVTYEKKGVSRYVSKITKGGAPAESAPEAQAKAPKSSTGFACEVCGAELKDGKYKKCFKCNKSGASKPGASGGYAKKNSYDSPEKTAQIQRGNALNAAASVASSQQYPDPETAQQFTLILADAFLLWLRAE